LLRYFVSVFNGWCRVIFRGGNKGATKRGFLREQKSHPRSGGAITLTITWVWLWDALKLLIKYYPRILAEQMLVRAIAARKVRRKRSSPADETVVTVSTQGTASVSSKATASDLPIWRKLSGEGDDPHVLFPVIHWEESTIEAHWRGRHRAFRVRVALEDVQQLLPEDALTTLPETQPKTQEEPGGDPPHDGGSVDYARSSAAETN
jgi:hypothetical protein